MGCISSKAVTANEYPITATNEFTVTGGGSLILGGKQTGASSTTNSNNKVLTEGSNGSSLLLSTSEILRGRKDGTSWEPGTIIDRPNNTKDTQVIWIPLDNNLPNNSLPATTISTSLSNEGTTVPTTIPPSTTDITNSNTSTPIFSSSSSISSQIENNNPLPPLTSSTYLRISYACHSKQGRTPKPPYKPNQDSFIALSSIGNNPQLALFGVFDGHGPRGEEASQFARVNLSDATIRHNNFLHSPFDAFIASFENVHQRFISPATQKAGVDTAVSGTTAITLLFNKDQYICANVGDSRAMIASRNYSKGLVAKALSSDHKPQRPDERARIQRTNAKILSEKQLGIEDGDPDKWYVCRVHNGTIRYGVLFTRSLGDADAHAHLGLIATPEIRKGNIDVNRDRFMVIASDGVWDYLGEDTVARIVAQATGMPLSAAAAGGNDRLNTLDIQATDKAQLAVDALVSAAEAKWEAGGERRRDDITVIVLMFRTVSLDEMVQEQIDRKLIHNPNNLPESPASINSDNLDENTNDDEITNSNNDEDGEIIRDTTNELISKTSTLTLLTNDSQHNHTTTTHTDTEEDQESWNERNSQTNTISNQGSIILEEISTASGGISTSSSIIEIDPTIIPNNNTKEIYSSSPIISSTNIIQNTNIDNNSIVLEDDNNNNNIIDDSNEEQDDILSDNYDNTPINTNNRNKIVDENEEEDADDSTTNNTATVLNEQQELATDQIE